MAKTISACMRCGSSDIKMPTMDEGVIAGITEHRTQVCARCGHRGPEMIFDNEDARAAFERALRSPGE